MSGRLIAVAIATWALVFATGHTRSFIQAPSSPIALTPTASR